MHKRLRSEAPLSFKPPSAAKDRTQVPRTSLLNEGEVVTALTLEQKEEAKMKVVQALSEDKYGQTSPNSR